MMKRMILTLCVALLLVLPVVSFAQGDGGGEDPDTPIDGGLSLLLAAGAAYGAKHIAGRKKDSEEAE